MRCNVGVLACVFWLPATLAGEQALAPYSVAPGLFDQGQSDLGLQPAPGRETISVFRPTDGSNRFNNGVVLLPFKGRLYAQWQSSPKDEDSQDTWVAYSVSDDGRQWSAPAVLARAGKAPQMRSSGGWWTDGRTLVAFINVWPTGFQSGEGGYTDYLLSTDGRRWSKPKRVRGADGKPVPGIIEQDPHRLASGPVITAFHVQPGVVAAPYYTDDPLGIRGWKRGQMQNLPQEGRQSRELEPSTFQRGACVVMVFRDQTDSFHHLAEP